MRAIWSLPVSMAIAALALVPRCAIAADSPPGPKEVVSKSTGMKLTLIPAGTFQMGSPASEAEREENEGPQHTVQISKPFYMSVTEVTQGEYEQVMGANPSNFSRAGLNAISVSGRDTTNFPVEKVSWFDAIDFCNKLSVQDGLPVYYTLRDEVRQNGLLLSAIVKVREPAAGPGGYRLPTEAEWEYACRANTTTPFSFGSALNGDKANVKGDEEPYGTTTTGKYLQRPTTVGSYGANAFGLSDMHGNVWEWCFDVYDEAEYKTRSGTTVDPVSISGSEYRVFRGCAYRFEPRYARSAYRGGYRPNERRPSGGFRVVR